MPVAKSVSEFVSDLTFERGRTALTVRPRFLFTRFRLDSKLLYAVGVENKRRVKDLKEIKRIGDFQV